MAVSSRVDVFARLPSDSNRARGKLYMPTECSFYTRTARLSRLLVVTLVPDASYRRAQRLQPARLLKKTSVEQTHRRGGRGRWPDARRSGTMRSKDVLFDTPRRANGYEGYLRDVDR